MSKHVVVDGSNLATEGRALPSLKQLNEAIAAYRSEHPDHVLIVVADATFGHRIDPSEVGEFDAMVETGQIVCPPAGAVGRGDAFVLTIADKADALILSNDSFQEFHGTYPWLFDESRLMGGKPVPFIGWVFVYRTPVRGPLSRKSVQVAKRRGRTGQAAAAELAAGRVSKEAMAPMPVPKLPPPRARKVQQSPATPAKGHVDAAPAAAASVAKSHNAPASAPSNGAPQPPRHGPINDLLPFLEFVEKHPVGTTVDAVIESFSSHGAYAMSGPVRVYLPLRLMAEPAPRSAREMVKVGETRTVSVSSFNAGRRGVDVSLLGVVAAVAASSGGSGRSRGSRKRGGRTPVETAAPATIDTTAVAATAPTKSVEKSTKRGLGRKAAEAPIATAVPSAVLEAAPATSAKKTPSKKAPETKAPAKKAQATKAQATKARAAKATPKKAPVAKAAAPEPAAKAPTTKAATAKAPTTKPPEKITATKASAAKAADAATAKKSRRGGKTVSAPVVPTPATPAPATRTPVARIPVAKVPGAKVPGAKAASAPTAKKAPAKTTAAKKTAATNQAPTPAATVAPAKGRAKKASTPAAVTPTPSVERASRPRTNPAR